MASRALLVSSDARTLFALGQVLTEMDISVEACPDLTAAETSCKQSAYAVIVVDGNDQELVNNFIRQVRLCRLNKNSLVVSVVDAQASVRSAFAMGANFVLYRPVSIERARASLRAASHLIKREKRKHPRLPVHAQASLSCPAVEDAPVTLLDLSEEGLSFQSGKKLPSKGKVYFRFTLPGQLKWIQLSGDMMWQDSTGRSGIRFVDVPQTAKRFLREWLESRESAEAGQLTLDMPLETPNASLLASDRRIQSRHACHLGADVYRIGSGVPNRCSLSDISVGGCYVELPSPFPSGTKVEVMVRTDDFKFRSYGSVQVVHPGFGMGVEFESHTREQADQVDRLIKIVHQTADPTLR